MLSFCLKCKKNTESIDPKVFATSNGKTMILSKCTICVLYDQNLLKARRKRSSKQSRY